MLKRDDIVAEIEKKFVLKCQGYGTGKYREKRADFIVHSKTKRYKIQKYVQRNIGCAFYFVVVK